MMATADQHPTEAPTAGVEGWKVSIGSVVGALRHLVGVMDGVQHQVDTRVFRLGFLTHAGRESLDRQTREERRVRAENAQQGHPPPSGDISPPGNFSAVAADADLTTTLRHNIRRLRKHLTASAAVIGIPYNLVALSPGQDPTVRQLLDHLENLVLDIPNDDTAADKLLASVYRDLDVARQSTETAVNGAGRTLLPDSCPHCGNHTLVVDFKDDLIRCDRDPKTGIPSRCVCSDPLCECKQKPVAYRHTWYRNPHDPRRSSPADTWNKLAGRLKFSRQPNQ